jgi:hypothetical protein
MNRSKKLPGFALAVTASALLGTSALAALDTTFNEGDLLIGFKTPSGTGSDTIIVANLGPLTTYRDAGLSKQNILNIGNIGSLLSSTYTAGATPWFDITTLHMGIIGWNNSVPIDNSSQVPPGTDPNSTAYISFSRNGIGNPGTANSNRPGNNVELDVQPAIQSMQNIGNSFDASDSNGTASLSSTATNSWGTYITGNSQADLELINIERGFGAGAFGGGADFGAAGPVENALDFYRIPQFSTDPNAIGRGQFLGTFTMNNNGQIDFIAVPEPSALLLCGMGALLGLGFRRQRSVAVR